METILLKDALKLIREGKPVDVEYIAANRQTGIAGEVVRLVDVVVSNTPARNHADGQDYTKPLGAKKLPSHAANRTINFYNRKEPDKTKRVRKAHIQLLTRINGKQII